MELGRETVVDWGYRSLMHLSLSRLVVFLLPQIEAKKRRKENGRFHQMVGHQVGDQSED